MNTEISRYRREVKKHVRCGFASRRRLLAQFDDMLNAFLEEYPDPTAEHLIAAFGPAETVSEMLMSSLPPEEPIRYRRAKRAVQVVSCSLVALFISYLLYIAYDKQYTVVSFEDEVFSNETTSLQEGEDE